MDTGSAYSILPFTSSAQPPSPALTAASGALLKAWGHHCVQLFTGGQVFSWQCFQCFPFISTDFLANCKMLVDLSGIWRLTSNRQQGWVNLPNDDYHLLH